LTFSALSCAADNKLKVKLLYQHGCNVVLMCCLSLCYSIVYYYNGAQRYEQFLHVGRLCRALILLGLALCLPSTSVSDLHSATYIAMFLLTSFSLPFSELSLVGLALDLVD